MGAAKFLPWLVAVVIAFTPPALVLAFGDEVMLRVFGQHMHGAPKFLVATIAFTAGLFGAFTAASALFDRLDDRF